MKIIFKLQASKSTSVSIRVKKKICCAEIGSSALLESTACSVDKCVATISTNCQVTQLQTDIPRETLHIPGFKKKLGSMPISQSLFRTAFHQGDFGLKQKHAFLDITLVLLHNVCKTEIKHWQEAESKF